MVYELLRKEVDLHADMEVVGPRGTRDVLLRDIAAMKPDVVILEPMGEGNAERCTRLLYHFPRAGAVVLSADQRDAHLYGLTLSDTQLGDMSPRELVGAIRDKCRQVAVLELPELGP
jgi:DNA-binding NarL/FixJ family response regulator